MEPLESLALPAPNALTAQDEVALSEMVSRIYGHCRAHRDAPVGQAYMTWRMDLAKRTFAIEAAGERLLLWTFTPHMDAAREVVGTHFEFHFAGRTETFFVAQPINFRGLHLYISGNEFERTFPIAMSDPVTEDQWDLWGRGLSAEICRHYEQHIYPRVVDTLQKIGARDPDRRLRVVDLGGGNGRLAEMICDGAPCVAEVTVLDRSAALVEQARRRASQHPGRMTARRADLRTDGVLDDLRGRTDVFILSGVVAQQVLDAAEALVLMRRCCALLPAGGFAIVPSYSPSLLTSREYEAMGFEVHNKTLNLIEDGPSGPALKTNDFYILQKKT